MPVDHTQNIIEVKNVSFSYGENVVLSNVSLNIHQGDYLGVIGPNGGGKTTLIKIMLGLLKPSAGSVAISGKDLSQFKDWSRIGYVAQKATNFDTNFPATVWDVVSMGRYCQNPLFKQLGQDDKKLIEEALNEVEMRKYKNRLVGDLSGGQQQRVFIARALAQKPQVIILDEPTSGVDVNSQEKFYELLKKLNNDLSITVVLVSHDVDVIANEATEIACINRYLVYHGGPKGLQNEDYLKKLYTKGTQFIAHRHL